jgi:hypothetical protein
MCLCVCAQVFMSVCLSEFNCKEYDYTGSPANG